MAGIHHQIGSAPEEVADGIRSVYFCRVPLARIDERTSTLNRGQECYHVPGLLCYRCSRLLTHDAFHRRMIDWSAWSREAVALMQERNAAWRAHFGLTTEPFRSDLASATLRFERPSEAIVASVCLVGTTSEWEGTFLWAWANEAIPPAAREGLERVRRFGEIHNLALLTTPEFQGSRPEALEILAIAGRILDGEGVFIAPSGDVTCFFVLKSFHVEPSLRLADDR